jgi:hypothetical protein
VDDERELENLERLAERLGIEVRSRVLRGTPGSGSGLCRVRGRWLVILNAHSTRHEKRTVLNEAIAVVQGKSETPIDAVSLLVGPRPRSGERPGLAGLGPKGRRRGAS